MSILTQIHSKDIFVLVMISCFECLDPEKVLNVTNCDEIYPMYVVLFSLRISFVYVLNVTNAMSCLECLYYMSNVYTTSCVYVHLF